MATATLKCAECGDYIHIHGSNRRDADYRASRHSGVCRDCENEAASAAAAEKAAAMDLPLLQGSPKQVAWAETLRITALGAAERTLEIVQSVLDGGDTATADPRWRHEARRLLAALHGGMFERVIDAVELHVGAEHVGLIYPRMALIDEARFWIDMREYAVSEIIARASKLVAADLAADAIPPEVRDLEAEVLAEATLRPEHAKSQTVAEVRLAERVLDVAFPERRDDFNGIVRGLGFRWETNVWRRKLDVLAGDPEDRLVETACRLLGAGFLVRVVDDALRARVLDGAFEPEHRRWITRRPDGRLAIVWPREDDFYRAARALPGSAYVKPHVVVPASSADEVEAFVERHGFRISPGARAAIDKWRADFLCMPVAAGVAAPEGVAAEEPAGVPPVLEVPDHVEVDDDLRDDD